MVVDTIVPVEIVTEYIVCATTPKAAAGPQNPNPNPKPDPTPFALTLTP